MTAPFPESADDLRAKARAATSPVKEGSYGYFVAKTRQRFGADEASERCQRHWEQVVAASHAPGADLHVSEGVSSWISGDGTLHVMVIARDPTSGQVAATRLERFPD